VKVSLNGVEVGEISEPVFATMKLVVAHDRRNYASQFATVAWAVLRYVFLALGATAALLGVWLTWLCMVMPGAVVDAVLAWLAARHAQSGSAAAIAAGLHSMATLLTNVFAMMLLVLTGARFAFGGPVPVAGVFRADQQRRIRMVVGTPASGEMTFRRVRTA
jgi:chromate transport protein ChrA